MSCVKFGVKWLKINWAQLLTVFWIFFVLGFIIRLRSSFFNLTLNEIGDFLAGAVGPVALLWLVRGYAQQNKAIDIQSDELRAQVKATQSLADNEARHVRIDYYKLVSACSKRLTECKLNLLGDTVTKSELNKATYGVTGVSNFAKAILDLQQRNREMARSISRSFQPYAIGNGKNHKEILISELDRLIESQNIFDGELNVMQKLQFADVEFRFQKLVVHSVNIDTLVSRVRLYQNVEQVSLRKKQAENSGANQTGSKE